MIAFFSKSGNNRYHFNEFLSKLFFAFFINFYMICIENSLFIYLCILSIVQFIKYEAIFDSFPHKKVLKF